MRHLCLVAALSLMLGLSWAAPAVALPFVVVVDAGHGGRDPGALGITGLAEKTVTLAAAQLLRAKLAVAPDIVVVSSRPDDRYMSLAERRDFFAALKPDLVVSIHADSLPAKPSLRGASVYTLAVEPTSAEAARKARRENTEDLPLTVADAVEDEVVRPILQSLMRRFNSERSLAFARSIVAELRPVAPLLRRPILGADFAVLRSLQTPSVLVELGYLSNIEDERLLRDARHLDRLASAVARAVEHTLREGQREMPLVASSADDVGAATPRAAADRSVRRLEVLGAADRHLASR